MIDRLFRKVSYVQIMVNTAASIAMIIDNIVIGRFLGVKAVGSYGAVAPLLLTIMAISQVLSTGGQMRCEEELGKGNKKGADGVASLTLILGLIFAIMSIIVCFTMQHPLLGILGVKPESELYQHTLAYLLGFIVGAPGFIGMLVLVPFIQLDGDKACVIRSTIFMTIFDCVGDIVAVTVFHGGMFGIGIASSISYYCALAVLLFHFATWRDGLRLGITNLPFSISADIFKLGTPAALQKVLRTLLSLTVNHILIGFGGAVVLGIFTVINSILNLFNSMGQGMGSGTLLLTGIFYSEKEKNKLKEVVKAFVKYSLIADMTMIVIVWLFATPLIMLFTGPREIDAAQAAMALRFAVIDLALYSLANCFKNYYQGIKHQAMTYVITVTEAFLFAAIAALPLMLCFGVNGICSVYAVGDFLCLVMIWIIVCVKNKSLSFSLDNFMLLDRDFGVNDDCYLFRKVSSVEEAAETADAVNQFVEKHGRNMELKRQRYLGVCVEELCKNIVTYGFNDSKKNNLEVSVIFENDSFLLRIRDDCRKYNPVEYFNRYLKEEPGLLDGKYGLKLVFGITEDINYFGTLGLNTVTIQT